MVNNKSEDGCESLAKQKMKHFNSFETEQHNGIFSTRFLKKSRNDANRSQLDVDFSNFLLLSIIVWNFAINPGEVVEDESNFTNLIDSCKENFHKLSKSTLTSTVSTITIEYVNTVLIKQKKTIEAYFYWKRTNAHI